MRRLIAFTAASVALVGLLVLPQPAAIAASLPAGGAGIAIPGYRLAAESSAQLGADLDRIVASGATWLRTDIVWGDIEYVKGRFDWSYPDRIVAGARSRGLKILGIATVLPAWARPSGSDWNYGPTTDAQRAGFATFVGQAANRYAGAIDSWEIWNEMNAAQFWAPAPSPPGYTALLKVAYPAIHAANPAAVVLAGGTGWAGGSPDIASTDWYRRLYAAGARPYFDAAATHPYFDFSGINTQEMARASTIRSIMDSAGDYRKLLWGTEIGAPTSGSYSLSESEQANFLPQAYDTWATVHDHGPLFWYTLNDTTGTDRESHFGLLRTDGTAKPAYTAFRNYLGQGQVTGASVTGLVGSRAPSGASFAVTMDTGGSMATDRLVVAIRSQAGATYDTLMGTGVQLAGTQSFSAFRRLPAGTYSYHVAFSHNGSWTHLAPIRSLTIGAVAATSNPIKVVSMSAATSLGRTTVRLALSSAGSLSVDRLHVAIRTQSGGIRDMVVGTALTLTGTQSFTVSSALPTGTYTYWIAYQRAGTWTDLQPTVAFSA